MKKSFAAVIRAELIPILPDGWERVELSRNALAVVAERNALVALFTPDRSTGKAKVMYPNLPVSRTQHH